MNERFLRVYRDERHVEDLVLDEPKYTVGRGRGSGILLDDESVSRVHAMVWQKGSDYSIEDLGSPNPTHVNGQPVRVHALEHGDRVSIGHYTLIYQVGEGVALTPPPDDETDGFHIAWSSDEATCMADPRELMNLREAVAVPSLRPLDTAGAPRLSIESTRLSLGRGDDVDVAVRTLLPLGRALALLTRDGDRCFLTRVSSLARVRVNGKRCTVQELEDGDRLQIGGSRFRIHIPARARAASYL